MTFSTNTPEPWSGQKNPHLDPWDQLNPQDYPSREAHLEHRAEMKVFYTPDQSLNPPHTRTQRERITPPTKIHLLEMEEARFAYLNANKDLKKVAFYQTGIRGTEYHRTAMLRRDTWGENFLELVPEPDHEIDPNAVAVDLLGTRIGYISANIAPFLQGVILSLRKSGKRVYTPGYVYKPSNGVIVLPTISKMKQLLEEESALTIKEFWNMLPQELHRKVFDNNYHFDKETATELLAYRHIAPLFIPFDEKEPEGALPLLWGSFLGDLRKSHKKKEQQQRTRRNKQMARLAQNGASYREIGDKYGMTASTVGNIVRELRRSNPELSPPPESLKTDKGLGPVVGNHLKTARDEEARLRLKRNEEILRLNKNGLSHREIGERVGLKRDTVKKILQSARRAN